MRCLALILACSLMTACHREPPQEIRTTFTPTDARAAQFIVRRIAVIEHLDRDGVLTRWAPRAPDAHGPDAHSPGAAVTDADVRGVLRSGEALTLPDHHGMTTVLLVDVHDDVAHLAYQSRFDHTSFGKNLVTVDGGVFALEVSALPR